MLLVLVGLRAVAGQVFAPASHAALPVLVPDADLESANAAVGIGTNGGEALGPLAVAVLLPVLDVPGVLLLDAGTFALSAALLALVPLPPRPASQPGRQASFLAETRTGLRYITTNRLGDGGGGVQPARSAQRAGVVSGGLGGARECCAGRLSRCAPHRDRSPTVIRGPTECAARSPLKFRSFDDLVVGGAWNAAGPE